MILKKREREDREEWSIRAKFLLFIQGHSQVIPNLERITKSQHTILFIDKWLSILEELKGDAPERGRNLEQGGTGQKTDVFDKPSSTISLNYVQVLF